MTNPYWHEDIKPHVIDFDEIETLCFEIYAVLGASKSLAGASPEELEEDIASHFHRHAERQLTKRLLRLAVLMRTLDDLTHQESDRSVINDILSNHFPADSFGTLAVEDATDEFNRDLSFRQACNKIIHAIDVRPVYDNGSNPHDEDYAWGMTGEIEMMGQLKRKTWNVGLDLENLLNACLIILRDIRK